MAGQMLSRGTTRYTRAQLSDELRAAEGLRAAWAGTGGSFQTTRPNLEEALRLAAHVLKEPRFPESEFEQLRNQTITSIESQLAEPNARASEALSKHFNAYPRGDWRYSPTLEESLADMQGGEARGREALPPGVLRRRRGGDRDRGRLRRGEGGGAAEGALRGLEGGEARTSACPSRTATSRRRTCTSTRPTRRTRSSSRARTSTCATTIPTTPRSTSPTTSSAAGRDSIRACRTAHAAEGRAVVRRRARASACPRSTVRPPGPSTPSPRRRTSPRWRPASARSVANVR